MLRRSSPVLLVLFVLTAVAPAAAVEPLPGPVAAEVLDVIDGDTIAVRARVWIGHEVTTHVRLDEADTPELRGRCDREKMLARAARDRVAALAPAGSAVWLRGVVLGKYAGRVVARVQLPDGRDLAEVLLSEGLARRYDGGRREEWCE